jgi:hypothetical protein
MIAESITREIRGSLTPESSAVMDSLNETLMTLANQSSLTIEASRAILAGIKTVRQICSEAGKSDPSAVGGDWCYAYDYPFTLGEILTLSRQGSTPIRFYFQIDPQGAPLGSFILENNHDQDQKAIYINLQKKPDDWILWKATAGEQTSYHFMIPPDETVPWDNTSMLNIVDKIQAMDDERAAKPAAQAPAPKPGPLPPPPTVVSEALTWHLVVQPGGQTMALKDQLSVGRGQDNDLNLEDKKLSRHHAMIEAVAKGWQVRDLGSTNGTWVKGQRINAPLLLKTGDVIELGDTRLTLELG